MASLRTSTRLTFTYPFVARLNQVLNPPPSLASTVRFSDLGRSSMALRAGLRVSALNAEIRTETAIVSANCW